MRPSSHEIMADSAVESLEPRVMQVLIELARHRGQVVSRETLIARCWSGRAVSEDAIQRCIARLRRVGAAYGGYQVETISRRGYRLSETGAAGAPRASLAVLAFDNLTNDPDLTFFSDGISDELLDSLAGSAHLKVIGRASSFQFRGADKAPAIVAAALKVTHLLDGSVRRSDGRIRISARLIETATERTVWTKRFDRSLADTFILQDEIARAVATAMNATFAPALSTRAIDPFAYELLQRARELSLSFGTPGCVRRAKALLEEAVIRAPRLESAWALLASVQVQYRVQEAPDSEVDALGVSIVKAAEQALALNPQNSSALASLAFVEPAAGAFQRQEEILGRAMAMPNSTPAYAPLSAFCASVGRKREALEMIERAAEYDPLHHGVTNWCAIMLWENGQLDESRGVFGSDANNVALPLRPQAALLAAFDGNWQRVDCILSSAYLTQAEAAGDRQLQQTLATIAVLRDPNRGNKSRVLLKARSDLVRTGAARLGTLCLLGHLGFENEAHEFAAASSFDALTTPGSRKRLGDAGLYWLFARHAQSLRADKRFVGHCARLGLVDYWTKTQRWPDCVQETSLQYDFIATCNALGK